MGLLDILTGKTDPSDRVPPLARSLAELFAYKQPSANASPDGKSPSQQLDDFFRAGPDGGPTAKGVIGALMTGGLMDVVKQFRGAGQGAAIDSWIGGGPNKAIAPADLSNVLSEEQIAFLMKRTGMSRAELLSGLSERLPAVVDGLTPDGRLPTKEEMEKKV